MIIYFDTTSWARLFETGTSTIDQESFAMSEIIRRRSELNLDFVTTKFQIDQMYSKVNSISITEEEKLVFQRAVAVCEELATEFRTYINTELLEFQKSVKLCHKEDSIHIVSAWKLKASNFITADNELFDTKKREIEKTLSNQWHPGIDTHQHKIYILNPIEFLDSF